MNPEHDPEHHIGSLLHGLDEHLSWLGQAEIEHPELVALDYHDLADMADRFALLLDKVSQTRERIIGALRAAE